MSSVAKANGLKSLHGWIKIIRLFEYAQEFFTHMEISQHQHSLFLAFKQGGNFIATPAVTSWPWYI